MLDPDLIALMTDQIVVQPVASRSVTGSKTYGAPVEIQGKVDWKQQAVESPTGRTIVARGIVYLAGVVAVDEEGLLTLPDGSQPPILGVQTFRDEDGPCYTTIIFE